jgi:hypothetical protein
MSLSDWKDIGTILVAIVGLITLIKGVYEYIKQGKQKRCDRFVEMRKKYTENPIFRNLFELLENEEDDKLRKIPYKDKLLFLGFYEELALMMNSNLLNEKIVFYMFGYYAIKCWDTESFWRIISEDGTENTIQKNNAPWTLFKKFVEQMKLLQDNYDYDNTKLKF